MSNEIREAVQMVLTRMETHPEDFYSHDRLHTHASARFGWVWGVLNGDTYGLNEAELAAIKQGYDKVMYGKFHDRVLESMLRDPEQEEILERQGSSLKYKPYQYTDPRMVFTRSQAEIAKRLGVSPQEYARAMSKVTK
jgi:hypothetical protein